MGCDIHLFVEVRKDGQWASVDQWEVDDEEEGREWVSVVNSYFDDRNYDLFGILADVRNGRGFAGIDMGDGFTPITMPKGLPADVSPEVKRCSHQWGADGHSHSWHTLADLLAYDWTQVAVKRGVVDALNFFKWDGYWRKQGEGPQSYSGDVMGGKTEIVTEEEMKRRIEAMLKTSQGQEDPWKTIEKEMRYTHCRVQWSEPYYQVAIHFWGKVIPRLLRLGKPEDVRIVFWFDN